MEKWFMVLLDSLKSRKKLYFSVLFIALIVLIKKNSPSFYGILHEEFSRTITVFYNHIYSSVTMFIFIFLFYWLARISDKKYSQRLKNEFEGLKRRESSSSEPLKTQVKDYMRQNKMVREITIINGTQSTIQYVRGWVEVYKSNKRIRLYPFEVKQLRANKKHQIHLDDLSDEENIIDEFNTFLEKINLNDESENDLFLYGWKRYLIRGDLNDYKRSLLEKVTGLNLKWLKRIFCEEVIDKIKSYFRIYTHFRNYRPVKGNAIKNLLRISFVNIPIVCIILFAVYFLLRDFGVLLYELFIIWFEFLSLVFNTL
ncbi:hypothetical protein [Paenibacillus sp. 8b26]|uniref:hypothetical protein n=1 Tax=Paenibacillus sp. 8b26 TaxID=3424133 RepID=UPI003D657CFD